MWTLFILNLSEYFGTYLPHAIIDCALFDANVIWLDPATHLRLTLVSLVTLVLQTLLAPDRRVQLAQHIVTNELYVFVLDGFIFRLDQKFDKFCSDLFVKLL